MRFVKNGRRLFLFLIFILVLSGCSSQSPPFPFDAAVTQTYPQLYEAVLNRDGEAVLSFTSDSSARVRQQAWRALAHTPVDSVSSIIDKVKNDGSRVAWFALSMQDLTADQLRDLEQYWLDKPGERDGVSLVLGQQGDEQTLSFLLGQMSPISESDAEFESALAISRLTMQFSTKTKQQVDVINAAFSGAESDITRAWLYGFYRGGSGELSTAVRDTFYNKWNESGTGSRPEVDQYVAGILGPGVFSEIAAQYFSSGELQQNVQMGIELAQLVDEVEQNETIRNQIERLLSHKNPHVVQQTLANLWGRVRAGDHLYVFIETELIKDDSTNPIVWLEALNLISGIDSAIVQTHAARLNTITDQNPFLYPNALQLWIGTEQSDALLNRIAKTVETGDSLKSRYAINALNTFWSDADNQSQIKPRVRALTFDALSLGDRGVTFSAQPLLRDSLLFTKDDFGRINRSLNKFTLPGDIEVYQTFGALYKQRFGQQARPVIDSLAALNYKPLNRSLNQAGWNVEAPAESEAQEFRWPDWDRLWELGKHPVWILETEKGTIKVEMNTLSAPATVSAIDSLTRAGAYDGVPFHRVVPNFVIQGGDIERQDGFGGPDFTIPTEAREQGFIRGAAGIASAGPDTEGSQYFFMHQWKPHLNGGYTLFGNVVEGLDVVDRIIVGDKVTRAYWE